MDNIISLIIGVLVCVIIAYLVVLPTYNQSVELQTNKTPTDMGWSNLSTANFALSRVLPALIILTLIVYVVRNLLSS
jgi:predicted RND superfamily exporter protein